MLGFVDGHSRLVLGMQVQANNTAASALALFEGCLEKHGYAPRNLRIDRGGEFAGIRAYMQHPRRKCLVLSFGEYRR